MIERVIAVHKFIQVITRLICHKRYFVLNFVCILVIPFCFPQVVPQVTYWSNGCRERRRYESVLHPTWYRTYSKTSPGRPWVCTRLKACCDYSRRKVLHSLLIRDLNLLLALTTTVEQYIRLTYVCKILMCSGGLKSEKPWKSHLSTQPL